MKSVTRTYTYSNMLWNEKHSESKELIHWSRLFD